jgi:hypothetical protein
MTPTLHRRAQLTAVAELRWRMFLNSLRSKRGKMELLSRIIVTTAFALGGLGAFAAAVGMSWYCVSQGKPERLAFPLWGFFFFWQVFPVMSTAFTSNPDSSDLLRFSAQLQFVFSDSTGLRILRSGQRDRLRGRVRSSARRQLRTPGVISLGAARTAHLRPVQPGVDADRLRLAGALAGAAPHSRNPGRSIHPDHAEFSTDRAHDGAPRQSSRPQLGRAAELSLRCKPFFPPALPPMPSPCLLTPNSLLV